MPTLLSIDDNSVKERCIITNLDNHALFIQFLNSKHLMLNVLGENNPLPFFILQGWTSQNTY